MTQWKFPMGNKEGLTNNTLYKHSLFMFTKVYRKRTQIGPLGHKFNQYIVAAKAGFTLASAATAVVKYGKWLNLYPRTVHVK